MKAPFLWPDVVFLFHFTKLKKLYDYENFLTIIRLILRIFSTYKS